MGKLHLNNAVDDIFKQRAACHPFQAVEFGQFWTEYRIIFSLIVEWAQIQAGAQNAGKYSVCLFDLFFAKILWCFDVKFRIFVKGYRYDIALLKRSKSKSRSQNDIQADAVCGGMDFRIQEESDKLDQLIS